MKKKATDYSSLTLEELNIMVHGIDPASQHKVELEAEIEKRMSKSSKRINKALETLGL